MPTKNVVLTEHQTNFVEQLVTSGAATDRSAADAIADSLGHLNGKRPVTDLVDHELPTRCDQGKAGCSVVLPALHLQPSLKRYPLGGRTQ